MFHTAKYSTRPNPKTAYMICGKYEKIIKLTLLVMHKALKGARCSSGEGV